MREVIGRKPNKLAERLRLVRQFLAFSNGPQLVFSKIVGKGDVLVYRQGEYRLVSVEFCADGESIRECLGRRVYHEAVLASKPHGSSPGYYVNVGANIGAFDVVVNQLWGRETRGVAVEMNPWTCQRLAFNLSLNHLSTRAINAAVTQRRGSVFVAIEDSGPGQSLQFKNHSRGNTEVPAMALADVPSPSVSGVVNLLKVDCEGSEYSIFAAADGRDLDRFENIVMEVHFPPPSDFSFETFTAMVCRKGRYQMKLLSKESNTCLVLFSRK